MKLIDERTADFTISDVNPGDRFEYGRSWFIRLKLDAHVDLKADNDTYDFATYSESQCKITLFRNYQNPPSKIKIEGREPEREKVQRCNVIDSFWLFNGALNHSDGVRRHHWIAGEFQKGRGPNDPRTSVESDMVEPIAPEQVTYETRDGEICCIIRDQS